MPLDAMFRWRGVILGIAAVGFIAFSRPTPSSLTLGTVVAGLGLVLRLWAISWIGPRARTRRIGPPEVRITRGPYRIRHPLYLANVVVAAGLGLACKPGVMALTTALGGVAAFYLGLACREERELRVSGVGKGAPARTSWTNSLRAERSTWLTVAVCIGLLATEIV